MADAQAPAAAQSEQDRLTGIGGWLILPIIGLSLTIILTFVNLIAVFAPDTLPAYQAFFEGTLRDEARPYIYLGLGSGILGIALVALSAVCLVRLLQRKRNVPTLMTSYYLFLVAVGAYEFVTVLALPALSADREAMYQGVKALAQAAIAAAIWIPYFRVSKRVKYTFTQ
jgi:hypothetical protein